MTPNKANIRKWVDALRSGKYEQGKGQLRIVLVDRAVRHCCLGVACDLTDGAAWSGDLHGRTGDGVLSKEAQSWLGIDDDNPEVGPDDDRRTLSSWNDFEDRSFDEIADLIEAEWLAEAPA